MGRKRQRDDASEPASNQGVAIISEEVKKKAKQERKRKNLQENNVGLPSLEETKELYCKCEFDVLNNKKFHGADNENDTVVCVLNKDIKKKSKKHKKVKRSQSDDEDRDKCKSTVASDAVEGKSDTVVCVLNKNKKKSMKHKKVKKSQSDDEDRDKCESTAASDAVEDENDTAVSVLNQNNIKSKKHKKEKKSKSDDEDRGKCESTVASDGPCETTFRRKVKKKKENLSEIKSLSEDCVRNHEATQINGSTKKSKKFIKDADIEVKLVDEKKHNYSKVLVAKVDVEVPPYKKKKSKRRLNESNSEALTKTITIDNPDKLERIVDCSESKGENVSKKAKRAHSKSSTDMELDISNIKNNEKTDLRKQKQRKDSLIEALSDGSVKSSKRVNEILKPANSKNDLEPLKADEKKNGDSELLSHKKKKSKHESLVTLVTSEAAHEDQSTGKLSKEKKTERKSSVTSVIDLSKSMSTLVDSEHPNISSAEKSDLSNASEKCAMLLPANPAIHLGQWAGVTLDAPDRQQKFLRLLGGFKKGGATNDNSSVATGGSVTKNLAMGKEQVKEMNTALESQFEKARDLMFIQQRGMGLGFCATPRAGKEVSHRYDQDKITEI